MLEYAAWLPGSNSSGSFAAAAMKRRAGMMTLGFARTALVNGWRPMYSGMPLVWLRRWRRRIFRPSRTTPGSSSWTVSSRLSLPSSTSCMTAAAMKLLVTLPIQKRSPVRIFWRRAMSARPEATKVRRPSCSTSVMTPGMSLVATSRSVARCSSGVAEAAAPARTAIATKSIEKRRIRGIRNERPRCYTGNAARVHGV